MMTGKQGSKQRLRAAVEKIAVSYLQFGQGGFTIIESLVALVIAAILLAAIAPIITLSVATRLQSRRVELATQAARGYIDGVRTKRIDVPLAPTTNTALASSSAPTPSGSFNCAANSYCTTTATSTTPTNLYCTDFDGDGSCKHTSTRDMVVQAFRQNNNDPATGYALGVRVYRADAFSGTSTLARNNAAGNNEKVTQASFTGGLGKRTVPLAEITADINDTVPKYGDLCTRIKGINPTANANDVGCSDN